MKGCIYIMTNPMLHGENGESVVKIGYADNVEARRKQLSMTAVPMDYRIYATYEVSDRLADQTVHAMIDKINPELRIKENIKSGKVKIREFYYMNLEDAYDILDAIATISCTKKRLKKWSLTKEQKNEDKEIKKPFSFSKANIKIGSIITFDNHDNIKCKVVDDKRVEYKGEIYSLSNLGLKLKKEKDGLKWKSIQGPYYFKYKGKRLTELRTK